MTKNALLLVVAAAAAVSLAACEIRVARDEDRRPTDVDVDTPFGDLSVTKDAVPEDVGVRVYPGARPLEDGDETDRANVSIDSPFVDLRVAALEVHERRRARCDRRVLSPRARRVRTGHVVCQGDMDFERRLRPPRCKSRRSRQGQLQVGVGNKGNFGWRR